MRVRFRTRHRDPNRARAATPTDCVLDPPPAPTPAIEQVRYSTLPRSCGCACLDDSLAFHHRARARECQLERLADAACAQLPSDFAGSCRERVSDGKKNVTREHPGV